MNCQRQRNIKKVAFTWFGFDPTTLSRGGPGETFCSRLANSMAVGSGGSSLTTPLRPTCSPGNLRVSRSIVRDDSPWSEVSSRKRKRKKKREGGEF